MKLKLIFGALFGVLLCLVAYGSQGMEYSLKQGEHAFILAKKTFEYKQMFASDNNQSFLAAAAGALSTGSSSNKEMVSGESGTALSVPVLVYHGIAERSNGESIALQVFRDQMFALKKHGWRTVGIDEFYRYMNGEITLPAKSFVLTFDDGRKDSYYPVDPILRALNFRAVMFIITGRSLSDDPKMQNHPFYLNKREVADMYKSGRWDIQVHTKEGHDLVVINESGDKGHYYSNKLWLIDKSRLETNEEYKSRIRNEFLGAKEDIKKTLGVDAISFAFPFGDFGQGSINFPESENIILKDVSSIYGMAFYQIWEGKENRFNYSNEGAFLIKRIAPNSSWSGADLVQSLEIGRDKDLPYQDNFGGDNGWEKGWGIFNIENQRLVLGKNTSTTGSMAVLDGAYLWKNYIFNAKMDWIKGENVSVLARYINDKNYIVCSFSDDKLRIEQYLGGKKRIVVEKKTLFEIPKRNVQLGIVANNDKVECLVNGNSVIYSYYLSPALSHGGIGIKTWDPEINNSEVIVKNIDVTEIVGDSEGAISQLPKTELVLKQVPIKNTEKPKPISTASTTLVISPTPSQTPGPIIYSEVSFDAADTIDFNLATSSAWQVRDGEIQLGNNTLLLSGVYGKSSSYFTLGGGYNLTNYKISSSFDWTSGSSASLLSRYVDNKNYMECAFTRSARGGLATLYIVENGQRVKLFDSARLALGGLAESPKTNIGMSVKEKTASCIFNNQPIITYTLPRMPEKGTFGFKFWDKNIGSSVIDLRELHLVRE